MKKKKKEKRESYSSCLTSDEVIPRSGQVDLGLLGVPANIKAKIKFVISFEIHSNSNPLCRKDLLCITFLSHTLQFMRRR